MRQGKAMSLSLPGDLNMLDMLQKQPSFVRPLIPAEVDSVLPGTAAARMGMRRGDMVVGINGVKVGSWNAFTDEIGRLSDVLAVAKTPADSMKVRRATLVIDRGGRLDTSSVVLSADLKVGFTVKMTSAIYQPVTKRYGFWESFPAGVVYGVDVLKGYVSDMKYVFTADGAKSLGGFGAIGSLFPPTWDWYMFWKMTAFLSIILAFMNILPIPALDGGHVLFLLYEMITRRKPSENLHDTLPSMWALHPHYCSCWLPTSTTYCVGSAICSALSAPDKPWLVAPGCGCRRQDGRQARLLPHAAGNVGVHRVAETHWRPRP